ncbi:lipid droplet-associated protein [Saccharopolyspora sp. HNM0983]|uniref:Lipid droplet-associated protein n=1 Tax=Saccharopolyspora montiporae TaxID=2781240 RepID=A0A929G0S7_9PSEU|nr:lipid droplet-associated protein [Saccharopolyspora sp. HNM0983]MBE9375639.1 lipid droplet-associated protein [Saccharopolyspora sp. HNM0983]
MSSLPLPVRVAAGVTATAVEQARQLPATLLGLPVTVASQALQASMRVQQQITELAIKGDEALAGLHQPEEHPAWATFDEDQPAPSTGDAPAGRGERTADLDAYDALTLPQLRGRLRSLSAAELTELIDHERATRNRPEYLRMLQNRLTRLRDS